jgi:protein pelota
MKIIHRNLRAGEVKVVIESLDDLWYLSNIVRPNDLVKAKTERRLKGKEDIERSGKSERVTITVAVKVEKAEFKLENDTFRINGTIEEGPEDLIAIGSHHTIPVEIGTILTVIKENWTSFELSRLKEAEKSTLRPKLVIAVIEEGDAAIGLVRESKIEYFDLAKNIGGKYDTKGRQDRKAEFYSELTQLLENIVKKENVSAVILAGAGFEKENYHKYLAEKSPALRAKCVVENIGSHGRVGINEVMKRSETKKIEDEINSAKDIKTMHRLLGEIGKDSGLAAYGMKDIENAAASGAIEVLLICDNLFMKNRNAVNRIIEETKSSQGTAHLLNAEGEAGKQLTGLGGIAGILRYRIK